MSWKSHFQTKRLGGEVQSLASPAVPYSLMGDAFVVKEVVQSSRFPFFICEDPGTGYAGYVLRIKPQNGASLTEEERSNFIARLEAAFRLKEGVDRGETADYTYSFFQVRRQLRKQEISRFESLAKGKVIASDRVAFLKASANNLETQAVDYYVSITATPPQKLRSLAIPFVTRLKAIVSRKVKYEIDAILMKESLRTFSDKLFEFVTTLTGLGFQVEAPRTPAELLRVARDGWRPNYQDPSESNGKNDGRSLSHGIYQNAASFLAKDLEAELHRDYWISDGLFQMLFSMEEAPDPNVTFTAFDSDGFLRLGVRENSPTVPYLGTFSLSWAALPRQEGDKLFRYKIMMKKAVTSDGTGFSEDKQGKKEISDLEVQHDRFISGQQQFVRATPLYRLQIPIELLEKYFDTSLSREDMVRTIAREVRENLEKIGGCWRLENWTYYLPWLRLVPGASRLAAGDRMLPSVFMGLGGALHLFPFFSTVSPENDRNQEVWHGTNAFLTEERTNFTWDHFSKHNGTAANMGIVGSTGSGKSVLAQTLVMMMDKHDPYVMVMDFGGSDFGSWRKLCYSMNGVELKFGSKPPILNPFHLSVSESLPNEKKRREIAIDLGVDPADKEFAAEIEDVYNHLMFSESPFAATDVKIRELVAKCPRLAGLSYDEIVKLLKLSPGFCRPAGKGAESIRLVLQILLSPSVSDDGVVAPVWGSFVSIDDVNDAVNKLYEEFSPREPDVWPTLSDFANVLSELNDDRVSADGSGVMNFEQVNRRLRNYCVGGLEPFLDGQTNANIMRTEIIGGREKQVAAKFILADMAGVSDKKKLALYMVMINDFMSNFLYNNKGSRALMIRDEAWLFLKSAAARKYLEDDSRLARKYGYSLLTITQQLSDFKSEALLNNTLIWFICSLTSDAEISMASKMFNMNEYETFMFTRKLMGNKIQTDPVSGAVLSGFSRFMLFTAAGKFFLRNKISKFGLWMTTTEFAEAFTFNFYFNGKMRGSSAVEVIQWLCTGEYKKDEDLKKALSKSSLRMPTI